MRIISISHHQAAAYSIIQESNYNLFEDDIATISIAPFHVCLPWETTTSMKVMLPINQTADCEIIVLVSFYTYMKTKLRIGMIFEDHLGLV